MAQEDTKEQRLKAWEQLPGESATDYAQFTAYLRMGHPRSVRNLCIQSGMPHARFLARKQAQWQWVKRAKAWDDHRAQQALATVPVDESNPYQRLLAQQADRAAGLHEAAALLVRQAQRRLQYAEDTYARAVKADPANAKDVVPPEPSPALAQVIKSASDVMDKAGEAQALALGITDILALQAEGRG